MTCRICLEDHQSGPLLSVCDCSGSCKHVHRDCLQKWIDVSHSTHCELCRAEYTHNYVPPTRPPTARSSPTVQMDCTWMIFIGCIWCGNLHGFLLAMNVWQGYTFKDSLVFACLLFNVSHVLIWFTVYSIHHKTALVSILWLLSVTFAANVASFFLDSYNDEMTLSLCFNALVSLVGLVLSVPTVQKWVCTK